MDSLVADIVKLICSFVGDHNLPALLLTSRMFYMIISKFPLPLTTVSRIVYHNGPENYNFLGLCQRSPCLIGIDTKRAIVKYYSYKHKDFLSEAIVHIISTDPEKFVSMRCFRRMPEYNQGIVRAPVSKWFDDAISYRTIHLVSLDHDWRLITNKDALSMYAGLCLFNGRLDEYYEVKKHANLTYIVGAFSPNNIPPTPEIIEKVETRPCPFFVCSLLEIKVTSEIIYDIMLRTKLTRYRVEYYSLSKFDFECLVKEIGYNYTKARELINYSGHADLIKKLYIQIHGQFHYNQI